MSGARGSDEIRSDAITAMGADLGQLYDDLRTQLLLLHYKWQEFCELFGHTDRVTLLNRAAPMWFSVVQKALIDDVLLHIARLTDPPHTGGKQKQNLTICRLPSLIQDYSLRQDIEQRLTTVGSACAFARDLRNRSLAHTDLQTFLAQHPTPLPTATSANVATALQSLSAVLNALEVHFHVGPVAYDYIAVPGTVGARSFLYYLQRGLDAPRTR